MKHDGLTFRRSRTLGFRRSDPEKDKDTYGRPVPSNYVSFVKIKDCQIYERDDRKYYDATNAKIIPVAHGGTYYGYGDWKTRKSTYGKWIRNDNQEMVFVHEYMQCTVYLAHDGVVYTSSIYKTIPNKVETMKM